MHESDEKKPQKAQFKWIGYIKIKHSENKNPQFF